MDVQECATAQSRPSRLRRRNDVPSSRPRLSVVVVNYLRWDDTARLVQQLRRSSAAREGDAEVVIVDNHSPPHRLIPRLRRAWGVSLRRWKGNRGFARAVNEGCRLSQGDWVLLLNPDTTVPAGFLDDVLARIDRYAPGVGIAGFRLHNGDGSRQLSTGRFPRLAATLTRLLLPRSVRKYTAPPGERACQVDWVTGCCLLARRDCLADVGGLDDAFFLYYEDVDLCRRARERGWSVVFDPAVSVVHHRPLHARAVPPHLRAITRHALLTYAGTHWPGWQLPFLGGVMRAEAAARRAISWWRGDSEGYETFTELDLLVQDVVRGDAESARGRLRRIVRRQESHRAAEPVDRRPQPQPSGPAAGLPAKRAAAHAAGHAAPRGR
ncbi:MAG: glycosyltransferase family 2 protein [Gemmataceae bacterium]